MQDHVPFGLLENDPSHRDAIPEGRTDWVARSGVHQWPADRDAGAHFDPAVVVEVEAPDARVGPSLVDSDRLSRCSTLAPSVRSAYPNAAMRA